MHRRRSNLLQLLAVQAAKHSEIIPCAAIVFRATNSTTQRPCCLSIHKGQEAYQSSHFSSPDMIVAVEHSSVASLDCRTAKNIPETEHLIFCSRCHWCNHQGSAKLLSHEKDTGSISGEFPGWRQRCNRSWRSSLAPLGGSAQCPGPVLC